MCAEFFLFFPWALDHEWPLHLFTQVWLILDGQKLHRRISTEVTQHLLASAVRG